MPLKNIDYLDNFNFDYEQEKFIGELFTSLIISRSESLALKDLLFNFFAERGYKTTEELEHEFDKLFNARFHDFAADHIKDHGI